MPIKGSDILLIAKDGTHLEAFTDREGAGYLSMPNSQSVTVFCAHPGFSAYYRQLKLQNLSVIELKNKRDGGAVIIPDGTGYIPGPEGRLNPILDTQGRTYIYGDNLAINGGAAQPVNFIVNRPFQVRDSHGNEFDLEVVAIIGRSSLIEYSN